MPNDTITITCPPNVAKNDGKHQLSEVFTIRMDASKSFDPDGDGLSFLWWQQLEIGRTKVTIDQPNQAIATLRIPADTKGDTIHIICEVHDDGPFHLVAYRRIIINIQ